MKTILAALVLTAFSAQSLLACDAMKHEGAQTEAKASLKAEPSDAKLSKAQKKSKRAKTLAKQSTEDKKI